MMTATSTGLDFVIEHRPMAERFWSKVDRPSEDGCWLWTASAQSGGYGQIRVGRGPKLAHRVAWELAWGPIPAGLTVDHLCFRPLCVNPAHLRLLTNVENAGNQRKATAPACRRGHPWTPENTSYRRGVRRCRQCSRASARKNYRRRKDALIPGLPIESLPERFGGKVTPQADDCWEWTGSLTDDGYGRVWRDGRVARAHRVAYELLVGPIEPGLELDHLCRNKACVNPGHLEPVTPTENLRRAGLTFTGRTHCLRGEHELTPENVYVKPGTGHRECRSCRRRHNERSRARAAAKASPTPGSQAAGAPCPAATCPTPAPVVAADEPAPSRESGT